MFFSVASVLSFAMFVSVAAVVLFAMFVSVAAVVLFAMFVSVAAVVIVFTPHSYWNVLKLLSWLVFANFKTNKQTSEETKTRTARIMQ